MNLDNVRMSQMSDKDWDALKKSEEKKRKAMENDDLVASLDIYNRMVQEVYRCVQYKNVTDLLQYKFIDVYDISVLTNVSLKEIKCIQVFLENAR